MEFYRRKWITIRVILVRMFVEFLMLAVVAFIVYKIIKEIYSINLVSLIQSILKPIPSGILISIIFLIITRVFYKRYKFIEFLDFLHETKREYENLQAHIEWYIVYVNSEIDLLKLKADILKSFSPIPIIILFIGSIFEKDAVMDLNLYSIMVLIVVLSYFGWLISVYNKFVIVRRKLAYYEQEIIQIKNKDFFNTKI
ncbi:hypothetical protein WAZ07_11795 [Bacillus sp. FJAT-51639]|uniref:ABC transporter ATP-binding protein n=1 Tax=Bacillus bruguierae TaxID=3127667 RepID=A0ABU8FH34_9BACI